MRTPYNLYSWPEGFGREKSKMQRVLIAFRNEDGQQTADRLRGALEVSQHLSCEESVAPAAGVDRLRQTVQAADHVLVVVDDAWASLGAAALEDERGRWLAQTIRAAFDAGRKVIAVTVDEAEMPARDDLFDGITRFASIEAFAISSGHWAEDVGELIDELSARLPVPAGSVMNDARRQILFAAGLLALLVVICGLLVASRTWFASTSPVIGSWVAEVDYGRGVVHQERLQFRDAGEGASGHASLLGVRRVSEGIVIDDERVTFHTRSNETFGNVRRELRHNYVGIADEADEADEADVIHFTLRTTDGLNEWPEVTFEARRVQ